MACSDDRAPLSRPAPHGQPRLLLLVLAGGATGALLRHLVSRTAGPADGAFPWATFGINVAGAFALGLLLELLGRRGEETDRRRELRLALGTGLLGAFTTYSALGAETALLVRFGRPALAGGYAVGSAVAGLLAAVAGIALAAALVRRQQRR